MRKSLYFIFLITLFYPCVLVSGVAYAQTGKNAGIFERMVKPIPDVPFMEQKDFEEKTRLVRKRPYGQEVLAYTMRVDKEWSEGEDKSSGNFELSSRLFSQLNIFYGKPSIVGRSRLEIQALDLDRNLTAVQWYIKYILEAGLTTEGMVVHSDKKVEALLVVMEADFSYYLRTLVALNGNKVILVNYYVPVGDIKNQSQMQAQVLDSFKLTYPKDIEEPEYLEYQFIDIAEIKYPEDWKVVAQQMRNIDRMNATLLNLKDAKSRHDINALTEGKMFVSLVYNTAGSTLLEEIVQDKKLIEGKGILIGDKIDETHDFFYDESMVFSLTEVYHGVDASKTQNEYEFWYTVMVGGNYFYFLTLLTPSRNGDFSAWAENTQSYKLIVKNFRPLVGAFLERD